VSVDWTPEQARKAQTYGICTICREPLVVRLSRVPAPMAELVCPNGHAQVAPRWLAEDFAAGDREQPASPQERLN
jgi:hypothetical protein